MVVYGKLRYPPNSPEAWFG